MCNNQLACPIPCQLCKRLCAAGDHFHAFEKGALHLCGYVDILLIILLHHSPYFRQEHHCAELCQSPGICHIATTPQGIESTFQGRHETFQYTKVGFCAFICSQCFLAYLNDSTSKVPGGSLASLQSHMILLHIADSTFIAQIQNYSISAKAGVPTVTTSAISLSVSAAMSFNIVYSQLITFHTHRPSST